MPEVPYPIAYVLLTDLCKPKREFMLRADVHGVVHWALIDMLESPYATPWCGADTEAKLTVFFRRDHAHTHPTCFWCMTTPSRRCRS